MTSQRRTARPRSTRPRSSRRVPAVLALSAAALALAACGGASAEDQLAILEEEPAEPVPEYVYSMGILEPGSARLLGTADGVEYYVGEEAATRGIVCLVPIVLEDKEEGWGASCATETDNVMVTSETVHGEAALVADHADDATLNRLSEEGWTEVSQNLWVR